LKFYLLLILLFLQLSCSDSSDNSTLVVGSGDLNSEESIDVKISSITVAPKTYITTNKLNILMVFNRDIYITDSSPTLTLKIGAIEKVATYKDGSGSNILSFEYEVTAGDNDNDGIELLAINKNGASLKDNLGIEAKLDFPAHNTKNVLVKTDFASIQNIIAPINKTYITNDELLFRIEFSENIMIDGSPRLSLNIGGSTVYADYDSGSNTNTLTFKYLVTVSDLDIDGIEFNLLDLNSGSIQDSLGLDADLSGLNFDLSLVNIDGSAPNLTSVTINSEELFTNNTSATIYLSALDADQMYITTDSSCLTGGSYAPFNSSAPITLTQNSLNTFYVKVKDINGNESSCSHASVTHDNLNPSSISAITIANNASDIASDKSSWSAPLDNGPSEVKTYQYAVSTTTSDADIISGGEWQDTNGLLEFQINTNISLTGGVDYYTLVRAVDHAGNIGAYQFSPKWNIIVSPEVVTNLEASNKTSESITLGWSYPQDNGTPITDYEIQIKGGTNLDWTLLSDGVTTQTSSIISGLVPETTYSLRTRAFNGINYSGWSNTLTVETLPNIEFFQPGYKAINISGAPKSQLVSFDDNNDIYFNGSLVTTLSRGEVYPFNSTDFMKVEGTKAFYVAGKLGTGSGSSDQANTTWATQAWVGKEFYFNLTRNGPLQVKVYAFTDSTITIKTGNTTKATQVLSADNGYTFSLPTLSNYQMTSTGFIVAFTYANQSDLYYDPQPLLPISTDILGFPSTTAKITSGLDNNSYTYFHSNGVSNTGTLNATTPTSLGPQGTSSLYASKSLRLISTTPIVANSNADSDGYCQAPFVPVSMLKKRFGLNVGSNWIALASDRAATVTLTKPDLTTTEVTLTRTGSGKTPFSAYISTDYPEGTILESEEKFQAWYQPYTSTYSGGEDETIMFGWDN